MLPFGYLLFALPVHVYASVTQLCNLSWSTNYLRKKWNAFWLPQIVCRIAFLGQHCISVWKRSFTSIKCPIKTKIIRVQLFCELIIVYNTTRHRHGSSAFWQAGKDGIIEFWMVLMRNFKWMSTLDLDALFYEAWFRSLQDSFSKLYYFSKQTMPSFPYPKFRRAEVPWLGRGSSIPIKNFVKSIFHFWIQLAFGNLSFCTILPKQWLLNIPWALFRLEQSAHHIDNIFSVVFEVLLVSRAFPLVAFKQFPFVSKTLFDLEQRVAMALQLHSQKQLGNFLIARCVLNSNFLQLKMLALQAKRTMPSRIRCFQSRV